MFKENKDHSREIAKYLKSKVLADKLLKQKLNELTPDATAEQTEVIFLLGAIGIVSERLAKKLAMLDLQGALDGEENL